MRSEGIKTTQRLCDSHQSVHEGKRDSYHFVSFSQRENAVGAYYAAVIWWLALHPTIVLCGYYGDFFEA